jgi:hypothetical protein
MKKFSHSIRATIFALVIMSLPCSLMAGPIVVKIKDLAVGPPEVEVDGAPNGWNFCECGINTPGVEDGGLITLVGVDTGGSINEPGECGWRFLDPTIQQPACASAVDIVWIQHADSGLGDLQIGFNSALPGHYYANPDVCGSSCDVSLGPLTYKWQVVYSSPTVVVLFKAQK